MLVNADERRWTQMSAGRYRLYEWLGEADIALRAQVEPNHFLKAPRRKAFKK